MTAQNICTSAVSAPTHPSTPVVLAPWLRASGGQGGERMEPQMRGHWPSLSTPHGNVNSILAEHGSLAPSYSPVSFISTAAACAVCCESPGWLCFMVVMFMSGLKQIACYNRAGWGLDGEMLWAPGSLLWSWNCHKIDSGNHGIILQLYWKPSDCSL